MASNYKSHLRHCNPYLLLDGGSHCMYMYMRVICASGDCLTSRPKGRSWPRELWFSIYPCQLHLSLSRSLPLSLAFKSVTMPPHSASTHSTHFYVCHRYFHASRSSMRMTLSGIETIATGPRDLVAVGRRNRGVPWCMAGL